MKRVFYFKVSFSQTVENNYECLLEKIPGILFIATVFKDNAKYLGVVFPVKVFQYTILSVLDTIQNSFIGILFHGQVVWKKNLFPNLN